MSKSNVLFQTTWAWLTVLFLRCVLPLEKKWGSVQIIKYCSMTLLVSPLSSSPDLSMSLLTQSSQLRCDLPHLLCPWCVCASASVPAGLLSTAPAYCNRLLLQSNVVLPIIHYSSLHRLLSCSPLYPVVLTLKCLLLLICQCHCLLT